MSRIRVKQKWYEQIEPSTFSEEGFERQVILHAPSIFPSYHVFQFKKPLKAPDYSNKNRYTLVVPDLVFVAKDYSEWWVVEVEMSYHSFDYHIKPQINKLLAADYGDDEIDYLCGKSRKLNRSKLAKLIKNNPTRILVILNEDRKNWASHWKRNTVVFAVFEIFCSEDNHEVYCVDGRYPAVLADKVSTCSIHPAIPRLLHIKDPLKLRLPRRSTLKLLYNDCLTEWRRIDEGRKVYLTAVNRNPLTSDGTYTIYRQDDGQLVLTSNIQ